MKGRDEPIPVPEEHPMSTPNFHVPGLAPIDDPAAIAWLEKATELALAFSREVHGDQPGSHARDVIYIQLAAHTLWRTSRGKPCWGDLDPDVLHAELCDVPVWQHAAGDAIVTYYAFFCFLGKHGHLERDLAVRAQNRFLTSVSPIFEKLIQALTSTRRPRTALPSLLN